MFVAPNSVCQKMPVGSFKKNLLPMCCLCDDNSGTELLGDLKLLIVMFVVKLCFPKYFSFRLQKSKAMMVSRNTKNLAH